MKTLYRFVWWIAYISGALLVQRFIPGVDALVPGFLLALQEQNRQQCFWLFILFTLIQEGTGNLLFGAAALWYGGQVLLFRMGSIIFVKDNIIFIAMYSGCLGLYHFLLTWLMCAVQAVHVDFEALLRESVIQTLIIPLIWALAHIAKPGHAPGGAQ
ncbi:MAG: hypothetical protein LBU06_04735 [Desulfovibrio sp.]|jgi:hypothetical protein|nr:hypothetical protein [Desulfovibrio sp.]